MSGDVARTVLELLSARGWSVGVAESLTGGLVVAELTSVPGASAYVRGGVVAYATEVKHTVLGVDADLLEEHGAVHPEVARQMALGVRQCLAGTDAVTHVGIATTGVAGPEPQDGQPVGTVFIAVATPEGERVEQLALSGDRDEIRRETVRRVLLLAADAVR